MNLKSISRAVQELRKVMFKLDHAYSSRPIGDKERAVITNDLMAVVQLLETVKDRELTEARELIEGLEENGESLCI